MAEYIKLTEELILSMRAGARAISNTKKYHGTIYVSDVFSDNPKEIPYLQASEILYAASEKESEDVAPVRHGRWMADSFIKWQCNQCHCPSPMYGYPKADYVRTDYCPNCGADMRGEYDE